MFGVARFEMSETSEQGAGSAAADFRTSSDGADPAARGRGQAEGEPDVVRTGAASGDRSAPSTGSPTAEHPVLGSDPGLRRLAAELGNDYAIVERFVRDYLSLLDHRLAGLTALLGGGDADATRLWILSLETTSAMLGAGEVVSAARAVRDAVETGHRTVAEERFPALERAVRELQAALTAQGFSAQPPSRSAAG